MFPGSIAEDSKDPPSSKFMLHYRRFKQSTSQKMLHSIASILEVGCPSSSAWYKTMFTIQSLTEDMPDYRYNTSSSSCKCCPKLGLAG